MTRMEACGAQELDLINGRLHLVFIVLQIQRVDEAFPRSVIEDDQVRAELPKVIHCEVCVPFSDRRAVAPGNPTFE